MKKFFVRSDSRNRVCLTKVLHDKQQVPFYAYETGGKIILELLEKIPAHEAWLYEPKNRAILNDLLESINQEEQFYLGSFKKYIKV